MSEPPVKKQKMGDETSTSQAKIFDPCIQDFADVKLMPTFVDHTELIKLFFGDRSPQKLFITAPSHFCKSTNLDMIQLFFERKSNEPQEPRVEESEVEDRHNYHVFENTNIMKMEQKEPLKKHFCAHPVLHVDFKILELENYKEAAQHILDVIRKAYKYHEPFLQANLKDLQKHAFQNAFIEVTEIYDVPPEDLLKDGLKTLCTFLYNACGEKRVLILVDEADAPVTAALISGLDMDQIKKIAGTMADVLGNITKGKDIDSQVQGVLLTGISYLKGVGYSTKIKATSYRFLNDKTSSANTTVQMYGLTQTQLDKLLEKLDKDGLLEWESLDNIKKMIKDNYNGYFTSPGKMCIYSLWSVLHFLEFKESSVVYADIAPIAKYYRKAFKSTLIGTNILQLLGRQSVEIDYVKETEIGDLVNLRDVEQEDIRHRNILFSLLMEVGFLTNAERGTAKQGDRLVVEIPNNEVEKVFEKMILDHKIQIGKFDLALLQECAVEVGNLANISPYNNDRLLKQYLKSLYDKLTKLCQQFDRDVFNESCVKFLTLMIMNYSNFERFVPEYYSEEDHGYVDVWAKNDTNTMTCVWELKANRKDEEKKTSMWAIKEIHGDQDTGKKGYMQIAEKTENFILLGLSVNGQLKPSICIRTKGKEKGWFISETEHGITNFAHHYKGWYDVLNENYI